MSLHSIRRCLITANFSIFPFSLFVHQFTPFFIKIKDMLNSIWEVSVNQVFVAWPWGDKHLFLTPWTVHDCVSGREKTKGSVTMDIVYHRAPWFSILIWGEGVSQDRWPLCHARPYPRRAVVFNEHERHPVPSAPIAQRKEFGYQTGQGCICSVIVLRCLFGCWQMKQELLEVFSNCRQR